MENEKWCAEKIMLFIYVSWELWKISKWVFIKPKFHSTPYNKKISLEHKLCLQMHLHEMYLICWKKFPPIPTLLLNSLHQRYWAIHTMYFHNSYNSNFNIYNPIIKQHY